MRGRLAFDFHEQNGNCGYDISKFRAEHSEYRDLNEDQLLNRLCEEAGINIKTSFRPWTKVIEAVGIALGVPVAVLILGWALSGPTPVFGLRHLQRSASG